MENKDICPRCKNPSLTLVCGDEIISHKSSTLTVHEYEWIECGNCGYECIPSKIARSNQRKIADTVRAHEGLLTSAEIKQIRGIHGLSQQELSSLITDSGNSVQKYESGEVTQSRPTDTLIRIVAMSPSLVKDARNFSDFSACSNEKIGAHLSRAKGTSHQYGSEVYLAKKRVPIVTVQEWISSPVLILPAHARAERLANKGRSEVADMSSYTEANIGESAKKVWAV